MTTQTVAPPAQRAAVGRMGHLVGRYTAGPGLEQHLDSYGRYPKLPGGALSQLAADAGLLGKGGAGFPAARKLDAVGQRRRAVVVGNAAEGEPASLKDRTLLQVAPNLVLDGLQLAADAVRAKRVVLYLHRHPEREAALGRLLAERRGRGLDPRPVEIVAAPHRFLAGEESALAARVSGGLALPRFTPPRVFESGVDGAPTLVQNVETLAQMALLARYGTDWYRAVGTQDEPGTMLTTVHTAGGWSVQETAMGTPLPELLGDPLRTSPAVLVGGYHGAWLAAETARDLRLTRADLRPHGASVGAGVIGVLPGGTCGLVETSRIVGYLAAESAGQCGPCLNGLPAIARGLAELAGPHPNRDVVGNIQRWSGQVSGRGACHHPDGTLRLVRSALTVFAPEVHRHLAGSCSAPGGGPFLPIPVGTPTTDAHWS